MKILVDETVSIEIRYIRLILKSLIDGIGSNPIFRTNLDPSSNKTMHVKP